MCVIESAPTSRLQWTVDHLVGAGELCDVETPTPETAAREAIRHWSRLPDLVEFAARRQGFGDTDGGFGITYPDDLDELDIASGDHIPRGFVRAYGFWGPPDGYEVLVSEWAYLDTLALMLSKEGHTEAAERARSMADKWT